MNVASWIILGLVVLAVALSVRYVWKSTRGGTACMDCPSCKSGQCGACANLEKMERDLKKLEKQGR